MASETYTWWQAAQPAGWPPAAENDSWHSYFAKAFLANRGPYEAMGTPEQMYKKVDAGTQQYLPVPFPGETWQSFWSRVDMQSRTPNPTQAWSTTGPSPETGEGWGSYWNRSFMQSIGPNPEAVLNAPGANTLPYATPRPGETWDQWWDRQYIQGPILADGPGQGDAFYRMKEILSFYGLNGLDDWLEAQIRTGASPERIALDLRKTPQFKDRFKVIDQIMEWNRQHPNQPRYVPTPDEVIGYEREARFLLQAAGLPTGFWSSNQGLQNLMGEDISLVELRDRIDEGYRRVAEAPPEVRNAFTQYFGVQGDAALAAVFLDPERALPELENMARAAQIGGAGVRYGLDLNYARADRLADLGLSPEAAEQGFAQVNRLGSLFGNTVGENLLGGYAPEAEDEGISAVFNLDPTARSGLERRLERREADFAGGGGSIQEREGLSGLGTAQ